MTRLLHRRHAAGALMALAIVSLCVSYSFAKESKVGEELKVGDMAPDFEMTGSDGNTYRLSDFRDEKIVVLAWFPRAFTGG